MALILTIGPISEAHFNPPMTLADASQRGSVGETSTSFANPAVTLARAASDTFAGIRPEDTQGFIAAQVLRAATAMALFRRLVPSTPEEDAPAVAVPHHSQRESREQEEIYRC